MTTRGNLKVVKTLCNMCGTRCGIDVYIENGKIAKTFGMEEHPINTLCIKAGAIPELAYSNERLTNPLRKVGGEFKEVSWDEALDFVADKLTDIKQKHGAKVVVLHFGVPFVYSCTEYIARRFSDLYGTPNYTSGASFCFLARTIGHSSTCGTHLFPHYPGSPRCMVIWGNNPTESRPLQADYIHAMLGRGAKLIVIDPKAIPLAKKADIHAQLRPGTDCALALGVLNVVINEGLYDKNFVEQWTPGFDRLTEHVKDWAPERVEAITWVKAETIRQVARMYASSKPACVSLGISMDHCTNGIQAIRAITALIAITGNLDIWKDTDELFEHLLKPTNITLDQLRQHPGGVYYAKREFQKYLRDGFNTPSRKVELYSETMKDYGYDQLPTFHEPAESPVSRPDLAEKYPLLFVSGSRTIFYHHSQHRNLPTLRRLAPEPLLEIHPETASGLGVADGNMVTVESIRGSTKVKARLTEDVHPKVVAMQHGWSEANCNYLTDDEARDPVSGYPGFRSVLCRVVKA